MSTPTNVTPMQNALDSVDRVARELEAAGAADALALKGALAWGWHAVGLLAYVRLQPQKELFDAWVQDYLHESEPELETDRDAQWQERERLSFLELLDLLSAVDLPILKPDFYQGWQDRTSRCHGLRRRVARVVGGSIEAAPRGNLLVLLAVYHRLVRLPAGVALDAAPLREALPALLDLAELLVDRSDADAEALLIALGRCRAVLS